MASDDMVYVEGLKEVIYSFNKADREISRRITARLRVLASKTRDEARKIAREEGFGPPGRSGRGTGALINKIRYSVRGPVASIRETATSPEGYLYPAIYEYGHGHHGHRPFMEPAKQKMYPETIATIEELIDAMNTEIFYAQEL